MAADLTERIASDFGYHPPNSPEIVAKHERVRELLGAAAQELVTMTPGSREQSLMLTSLEEAMFWANGAIARHQ